MAISSNLSQSRGTMALTGFPAYTESLSAIVLLAALFAIVSKKIPPIKKSSLQSLFNRSL
jgi:hypothetical protein